MIWTAARQRTMITQEPGKALAKSFCSPCGIQINKYFSRVNRNTSHFCHSASCPWQRWVRQPSPPTAHRQACSRPCIPTQTIQTCSPFEVSPALSKGLDKKVFSDLNYSPVPSSKPGLSGHLGGMELALLILNHGGLPVTLQQQRNKIWFARKEHSWCEKTPK